MVTCGFSFPACSKTVLLHVNLFFGLSSQLRENSDCLWLNDSQNIILLMLFKYINSQMVE